MIKAAFFDIDGTLVSFKTHRMPASTRRALAELHPAASNARSPRAAPTTSCPWK